jgi:hypothetical protein
VFKLPGFVVQVEPSYSSVAPVDLDQYYHQNLMLQFAFLGPLKNFLAVFKPGGEVVQVEPSYSSVAD